MSKRTSVIFAVVASLIFGLSNSTNPPNGRTGAPGDGACNECHTGSNAALDGDITISGLPSSVDPNMTYPITITLTNPNGAAMRGGFQWVALDGSNGNAGSMTNPSSQSVTIMSNGRSYHEHSGMNPFGSPLSWTVDWTAPSGPAGDNISLYSRGVIGNGSGSANDRVVSSIATTILNAVPTPPTVAIVNSSDPLCHNQDSGIAEVIVSGGTTPYMFLWSNGSTSNPATDLPSGMNTVTVTDSGGLTATASVSLANPIELEVEQINIIDQICLNASNGFIEVEGLGGTPSYMYQWSTGATTHWIANLSAGDYDVTVFDSNGCTATASYSIVETGLSIDIVGPTELCDGESIILSASGTYSLYTWSTGSVGPTTIVSSGGNVSLLVTDNTGCTGNTVVQITELPAPNVTIQGPAEVCPGIPNTLSIPGSYTDYLWSDGSTTQSLSIVDCGTYSATVSDANGCTGVAFKTIECSEPFEITLVENTGISCTGEDDGLLEVGSTVSTSDLMIAWSNGESSTVIDNLSVGTYSVTMTNVTGCSVSESYEVTGRDTISLVIDSLNLPICHDDTTSFVIVSGAGGTAPYSFFWPNDVSGDTITQFGSGSYQVTLVDGNSCVDSAVVTIPFVDSLQIILEEINHVYCNGDQNGSIEVSAIGGHGSNYEFFWENGTIDTINSGLAGGLYAVYAIDSLGCGVADTFEILENIPLQLTATVINETQAGLNDGTIAVIPMGGNGNYSFVWSTEATSSQITNLSPGSYSVTIMDGVQCTIDSTFIVSSGNCNIQLSTQASEVTCFNGNNGAIEVSIVNGLAPYTFEYSSNITSGNIVNDNLMNLQAGEYSITVTDAANCITAATITINQPTEPIIVVTPQHVTCFGANDGSIELAYEHLVEPVSILVSGNGNNTLDNLSPGVYSVSITDANTCSLGITTTIEEPSQLLVEQVSLQNASCASENDGIIQINALGGVEPYEYNWSNDSFGAMINVNPGSYTATIVDANQCEITITVDVEEEDTISPNLELMPVNVFIGLDGAVSMPSINEFVVVDSDNCSETTLALLTDVSIECFSAIYEVIIQSSDDSGNISTDTTELVVTDIVGPQIQCPQSLTFGACQTVSYEVTAIDNCDNIEINLLEGLVSGDIFPIGITTVVYEVLDSSNNRSECSFDIEVLPELRLNPIEDVVICFGESAIINFSAQGGSGDYTILLDGQEDWGMLTPGQHTVQVIDSNGCEDVNTFEVIENTQIQITIELIEDETILDASDGLIRTVVTGGTEPYNIDWFLSDTLLDDNTQEITGLNPGTYSIVVSDANGCTVSLENIIINPGMLSSTDNTISVHDFDVYPNPARDILYLMTTEVIQNGRFLLSNLNGEIVMSGNTTQNQFDIESLAPGIYFITLRDTKGATTKKWVKL